MSSLSTRIRRPLGVLAALLLALILAPGVSLAAKSKSAKVDLNSASQKELEDLPGVGEATAKKIIAGRPYSSVDDLEKAGVSKSTVDKIRSLVTVKKGAAAAKEPAEEKTSSKREKKKSEKSEKSEAKTAAASSGTAAKVDLNTASEKELEDLPGVGKATAKKIVAGRPYSSVDDLAKAGVSKRTIDKIASMVTVSAAGPRPASAASRPSRSGGTSTGSSGGGTSGGASSTSSGEGTPSSASSSGGTSGGSTSSEGSATSTKRSARTETQSSQPEPSVQAQTPPQKGMVWVNTATGVYHYEGDRWYGKTKQGKFMSEQDALKAGYRASKEKVKKD